MKSIVNRIAVVLLVGALTSVAAFAKVQKHKITFENDTKVNGTLVKKGTYDLKFDDATGQLSIVKNGKEVAQAMVQWQLLLSENLKTCILHATLSEGAL